MILFLERRFNFFSIMNRDIKRIAEIKEILSFIKEEFKDVAAFYPKCEDHFKAWHISIKSHKEYTSEAYIELRESVRQAIPDMKVIFVCVDIAKLNCKEKIVLL